MTGTAADVTQDGELVVITGRGISEVYALVEAGLRWMKNQGIKHEQMSRMMSYRDVLAAAHDDQLSQARHPLPSCIVIEAHSKSQGGADWISVAEAAEVLRWNTRRTQRLAQKLYRAGQAKRIGNSWALAQAPVLALKRQQDRSR